MSVHGSTHRVLQIAAGNPVLAPGLAAQQEHGQGVAPAGEDGEGGAALAEVGGVGAGEQGEAAPASQEGVQVSSAGVRQHFIGPVVGHRDLSLITFNYGYNYLKKADRITHYYSVMMHVIKRLRVKGYYEIIYIKLLSTSYFHVSFFLALASSCLAFFS